MKFIYPDGYYIGELIAYQNTFLRHGFGVMRFKNGAIYEGEFKKDKMDGFGIYTFRDHSKYIGYIKDNQFNGYGKKYYRDGTLEYQGNFKDGLFNGEGTYYFKNTAKEIESEEKAIRDILDKELDDNMIAYEDERQR